MYFTVPVQFPDPDGGFDGGEYLYTTISDAFQCIEQYDDCLGFVELHFGSAPMQWFEV